MISSCTRASEVIRRIRTLARNGDPERQRASFNEIVSETLGLVQFEVSRGHVELRVELAPIPVHVCEDRVKLQQVMLNLIINACADAPIPLPQPALYWFDHLPDAFPARLLAAYRRLSCLAKHRFTTKVLKVII